MLEEKKQFKKKKNLIYLRDYFESLPLPSNRLMKHTSTLDLIILHKEEGKKTYSRITSPGIVLGILVVPLLRSQKTPSVWLLFLCAMQLHRK